MNWEAHRREDGSIDLVAVFTEINGVSPNVRVTAYLNMIQNLQPVKSRQTAAVAIAVAYYLA